MSIKTFFNKLFGIEEEVVFSAEAEEVPEVIAEPPKPPPIIDVPHKRAVEMKKGREAKPCLLYTSPSPRDQRGSRMPSSA